MLGVFLVVAGADIHRRGLQSRGDDGDIAEAPHCLPEAELLHEGGKFPVAAAVKYRVIPSAPVQFHDEIDLGLDAAPVKQPGAHGPDLLVLAEQHMAACPPDDLEDHKDTGAVIPANALGGHHDPPLCGVADVPDRLMVYRIQVRHQQHRQFPRGVEKPPLAYRAVPAPYQVAFQHSLQFLLRQPQDSLEQLIVYFSVHILTAPLRPLPGAIRCGGRTQARRSPGRPGPSYSCDRRP